MIRTAIPSLHGILSSRFLGLKQRVCSRLLFDLGGEQDAILLSGTGRSGTTWVQELLNFKNDFRVMFEPFYPGKVSALKDWKYKQYIRANDSDTREFKKSASTIISGQLRNPWVDRYNSKLLSNRRLIKDIRTNLLLPWIKKCFPKVRIVLVLRHPFAVASSRCALGWTSQNDVFWEQANLVDDHIIDSKSCYRQCSSEFQRHVFAWCVETIVPLREMRQRDVHVCYYESLLMQAETEIPRLFNFTGVRFSELAMQKALIPSAQSRRSGTNRSTSRSPSSWRDSVSADDIAAGNQILCSFGLDVVYNEDDLPCMCSDELLSFFNDDGQRS